MPIPDRRAFLSYFATTGLGTTLFPGVLWARLAAGAEITPETVKCAEEIAGLEFSPEQREMMVEELGNQEKQLQALRAIPLPNDVPPAIQFDPVLPGVKITVPAEKRARSRTVAPAVPANLEDLAFLPVTALAELVRRRKVTSTQLTRMYLDRLKRYDPVLKCVITLTEERALRQARAADEEISRGKYRGPLHGIPWGAKDLLAVKGYPTTWGTGPYKDQVIDTDATVVRRLDDAGAVLLAKLTLGELAYGDVWFGGMTRNPWKTDQGSSGSSAGPASATAAGLVGFAIGSETLGSISSPSTRCGATGLRPTFGRVPRTGAMALSWSMDKLGPICRSVEDCALVLEVLAGPDGSDPTVHDVPFAWNASRSPRSLRVGYVKSAFDADHPTKQWDDAALDVFRKLGIALVPVEIPDASYDAMRPILTVEAAAAFDELTRSGRDKEMTRQTKQAWPNTFRAARFLPAVEYVNANRLRTLTMRKWDELMRTVDVIVAPTFGQQLVATNLTGHPAVIVPNGFRDDGTPVSLTFLGGLYQEANACVVAHAYQQATDFHLKHPTIQV
jgi:Asp-tRNA(Asn)/Glu-tRNA(Gln) amidotransferase A subunit family amidase